MGVADIEKQADRMLEIPQSHCVNTPPILEATLSKTWAQNILTRS
jgi:hypothetical protein